jgi:uncharacterized protein involved in exopolysaccharide biosynthesis
MSDIERYGLRPQVAAALQADMGAPEEKTSLNDLLHVLRKRKGTILGLAVGTFVLTAVLTLLQRPIYQATTRMLVQVSKPGFGSNNALPILGELVGLNAARSVGTEVEVLQSNTLLDRAVVEADSPKIQQYRARIAERERRRTAMLSAGATGSQLSQLDAEDQSDLENINREAERLLEERRRVWNDPEVKLPKVPRIRVETVRDTDLVAIAVEDPEPNRAQNMANAITAIYLDQNRRQNSASAGKARQFVEAQMADVKSELIRAEQAIKKYKEHTRSVDLAEETKLEVTRLAELEAQRKAAETEYQGLKASVESIRRQMEKTPVRLEAAKVTVRNPVVSQLEARVADLEVQRAALIKEYTPEAPEVQQIDAQLKEARARIGQEVKSLVGETAHNLNPVYQEILKQYSQIEATRVAVGARITGLTQAVNEGRNALKQLPTRALTLAELTRNALVLERTYMLLNERYHELRVSEAAQLANARVVDVARKPRQPIRPNKRLNLGLGLSFGLLLGLAIAFLQEHLDNSVKTPDQMEREFGLPTLGMLADIREGEDRVISQSRPQAALAEALRMVPPRWTGSSRACS